MVTKKSQISMLQKIYTVGSPHDHELASCAGSV